MTNNPFPEDDPQKIYAPPAEYPEGIKPCPSCGGEMEKGNLFSNSIIKWHGEKLSKMDKFMSKGNPIAKIKSGLGCNYPAYHCKNCNLFTLSE